MTVEEVVAVLVMTTAYDRAVMNRPLRAEHLITKLIVVHKSTVPYETLDVFSEI